MAYPPTGSVQTECTRLPVMLRTKGRFLCQRTIGFVGLQKHINSGYAFAERQIAHNGKRGKGTRSPHGLKDYPTCLFIIDGFPQFLFAFFQLPVELFQL